MTREQVKQQRFKKHFKTFIDIHKFPNWELTNERMEIFMRLQSLGKNFLTKQELEDIYPLIWAQKLKEITIQQLIDEMSEWWSNGWGWIYPIEDTIQKTKDNRLMLLAFLRIKRKCLNEGFLAFFLSFTGITEQQRQQKLSKFLLNNN